MNPWDVGRLFCLYRELLLVFEPSEAETWLMREQKVLNGERPCAIAITTDGYYRVLDAVRRLAASVNA